MDKEEIIRCMLLPLAEDFLLLPNVTVAEVIAFIEPKKLDEDALILGEIDWRGVNVPIMSFEKACGLSTKENSIRDRIAILYNPDGDTKKPYIGIKLTDIPKSFRADKESLVEEAISVEETDLVVHQLLDDDRRLLIPNMDALFQQLD